MIHEICIPPVNNNKSFEFEYGSKIIFMYIFITHEAVWYCSSCKTNWGKGQNPQIKLAKHCPQIWWRKGKTETRDYQSTNAHNRED